MTTSGSFSFSPSIDDIITDAYERCGIEPSDISAQMWDSAMYSFNGVMAEMTNMQLNLWEVEPIIVSLQQGVRSYQLPAGTVDLLEAYRRSYNRVLGGTPATSAGGTVAYAFDSNTATSCTQVSPNGNISYDYGSGNPAAITMVGYQSTTTDTLTLIYEASNDGSTWVTMVSKGAQSYPASIIMWDIVRVPGVYRYYRVRASGGGTLNPEEVYFCDGEKDYPLGRLGREEYDDIAFKTNQGLPVSYYVERTINPLVHLYLTPDDTFTMIKVNRIRQLEIVSGATQTIDSPFRFIEAFTGMLAVKLAVKRAPDRLQILKSEAADSVKLATTEDRERVRARFVPDMSAYRL